ncbi:MAG: hypothetical protein Q7W05_08395 [Deltaproteobacteria bacterium]|nr:hypothetical protein [Deltaproteobacteria bacterium]
MILAGPGARRNLAVVIILVVFLFVSGSVRPVKVVRDRNAGFIVWLWAWQKCRVNFINSVTHLPVDMSFGAPWMFSGFSVRTDPGTEEYYTAGGYSWNEQLSKEQTRNLDYCSEVGIDVSLGTKTFKEQGGCISLRLLWPPGNIR